VNTPLDALKRKWTARVIVILVGLTTLLEVAHSLGLLEVLHLSEAHVTDAIVIGTFLLAFLLVETFGENEKKLKRLLHQVDATASIARFSDLDQFHSHWKHMRQTFGTFTIVGTPIPVFSEQFVQLAKDSKRCRLCLGIDLNSQELARAFLSLGKSLPLNHFELHEFSAPPNGFWLIAYDHTGNGLEAIICFPHLNENSADGLYLTGAAAKAFIGCISPLLVARNVGGEAVGPIRVYSEQQIETVLDKKTAFNQEMLDVEGGIRLSGVEDVSKGMTRQLEKTARFVDVTHICGEKTIPLLRSEPFVSWIDANYVAARRGVVITRIFLVPRALRGNQELLHVIGEMRQNNITVLICDWEGLEDRLREDFSLYDDEHVVYISRGGGAWLDEDQTRARISDSMERVRHFRGVFNTIKQRVK
jgi:hypothetical protein